MSTAAAEQALSAAMEHHRRGDRARAEAICRQVLADHPDHIDALNLLGALLLSSGRNTEAATVYERAAAARPDLAATWSNLGFSLVTIKEPHRAEVACRRAIVIDPRLANAHANLGSALQQQARNDEAIAAFRTAIELNPHLRGAHENLLLALNYVPAHTPQDVYAEHVRWAERHADALGNDASPHANDRDPDRRLRVGYVSPDFRGHSVAFFIEPLLEAHDRGQVEACCYSDVRQPDETTARLKQLADRWCDTAGVPDDAFAARVRADEIDVLIDLAGHTTGNRQLAFARRAAPVQVSYLGYPNTTGLAAMEFRITDGWADPVGVTDAFHTEQLIRLPRTAWCYRPPRESPRDVPPPPCIANGHVTFGSFNKHQKISPLTIDTWAELLRVVPGSRLVIKSTGLRDAVARRRLADAFAARGVTPERLDLLGPVHALGEHLSMYGRIDVALDTFPYHGTTTTCDALYNGVPVVTQAGQVHVSRVGVSLLHAIELDDLVAQAPQQYVEIAAALARDPQRLSHLRRTLRERVTTSPLMDAPGLAREMESAYRRAWRAWCDADREGDRATPAPS